MHSGSENTVRTYNEEIDQFIVNLEAVPPSPRPNVVPLGFTLADYLLGGGLRPGELTLIAGTSNIGKSSLAANVTKNVAVDAKFGVLAYSLQKTISAFMLSVLATSRNLNRNNLDRAILEHPTWSELSGRNSWGTHGCIRLVDSNGIESLDALTGSIAKSCTEDFTPSLIVIDNLQMLVEGEYTAGGLEQVVFKLKQLTARLKAPILLLSHVNVHTQIPFELFRLVDNALILSETRNRHELRCTKNAHGGLFNLPLQFHLESGSFSELTQADEEPPSPTPTRPLGTIPPTGSEQTELNELRVMMDTNRALLTRHGHIAALDQKLANLQAHFVLSTSDNSTVLRNKTPLQLYNDMASLGLEFKRVIEACHLNRTFECAYHEASDALGQLLTTEEAAEFLKMPPSNVDHAMRKGGFHRVRIPYASSGYPRIFWATKDCQALLDAESH